jgi:putative ABC transport system permease protein
MDLWHDVRQAARFLRAAPGFASLAILTLAVGIAANTAIFSAVSTLLLRPLPIPDVDRVVYGLSLREGFDPYETSLLDYEAFRAAPAFASSGLAEQRPLNLVTRADPERVNGAAVTDGYLSTLDVRPILGRRFDADDDRPGAPPTIVIGYDLWRRRFGARPDVIGQTLTTDDGVWTILGVMPRGFDAPARSEAWMPARIDTPSLPIDRRLAHNWDMVARLRPDAALDSANAALEALAARLERDYPQHRRGWTYRAIPLRQQLLADIDGRRERALAALVVAFGVVLLICCANVAGLLLVRGVARQREVAVRLALGAARSCVIRQLVTESGLLALAAGMAGLLAVSWIVPIVAAISPIRAQAFGDLLADFRIDARVLAFATAVSAASAVLSGLAPALRALAARDLAAILRSSEHRAVSDAASRRWLNALVVGEVALAAALVATGSLAMRSFARLRHVDVGFRPERTLTLQVALPETRYAGRAGRVAFLERALERLRAIPGVEAAGASTNLPLDDRSADAVFTVEGRPPIRPSDVPITAHRLVTPGYLETLGVRVIAGRLVEARDRAGALPVVVVTREFVRQAWPDGADPIGRRVRRGTAGQSDFPWLTVVGVVGNVKEDRDNFRIDRPVWYLPYAQADGAAPIDFALRMSGGPSAIAASAREAIHAIDPLQPITRLGSLTDQIAGVTINERFSAILVASLAAIGLLLAGCGLYGVVAYSVSQRRAELGLRLALGATPGDLVALTLRSGATLVAAGLAIGLAAARAAASLVGAVLYEVPPGDPATFLVVPLIIGAIGLLACYVPARSAARIDPGVVLRN